MIPHKKKKKKKDKSINISSPPSLKKKTTSRLDCYIQRSLDFGQELSSPSPPPTTSGHRISLPPNRYTLLSTELSTSSVVDHNITTIASIPNTCSDFSPPSSPAIRTQPHLPSTLSCISSTTTPTSIYGTPTSHSHESLTSSASYILPPFPSHTSTTTFTSVTTATTTSITSTTLVTTTSLIYSHGMISHSTPNTSINTSATSTLLAVTRFLRPSSSPPSLKPNATTPSNITDTPTIYAYHLADQCTFNITHQQTVSLVNNFLANLENQLPSSSTSFFCSPSSVRKHISSLRPKTSPGPDNIPPFILQNLSIRGYIFLANIFNACFRLAYFPTNWKIAKIFPLHKKGKPKNQPSGYRPISLLNTASKLLEYLILEHISPHIQDQNLLPHEQFGFRADHSAPQQLYRLIESITTAFNRNQSVAFLSLDLKCAFDQVWHNALLFKLAKAGFDLRIIKIIQSYLLNRKFFVSIDGMNSPTLPFSAGVPQGSVLAPILFSLFLFDIPRSPDHRTSLFLYADDTALTAIFRSPLLATSLLQSSFDPIQDFLHCWGLTIKPSKTKAIIFSRRYATPLPSQHITILNQTIDWSPSLSYLGLILDARLHFHLHIAYIKSNFNAAFSKLYSLLKLSPPPLALLIYKAYLRPRLTYAAPTWFPFITPTRQNTLQILQNKTLRVILHVPKYTLITALHQLAGIQYLHEFILLRLLPNFAQSLVSSSNPTLSSGLTTKFAAAPRHASLNYIFTPDPP